MDVVNPGTAEIKLNKGFVAIVDADDYERVSQYHWYVDTEARRKTAYARSRVDGRQVFMHRFIMNARPGQIMDHINRNGLDNRKANLRFVTVSQNHMNRVKSKRGMTSKYKGVSRCKWGTKRWRADLQVNGKEFYVYCKTEIEAARAYDEMAKQHYGEYAHFNLDK